MILKTILNVFISKYAKKLSTDMEKYFGNKYRILSARLKDWDYGSNAIYFVTICTHERKHYFGEIVEGNMILNKTGELVQNFWVEIPNHFPYVKLHTFVIMPNHVHGIIEIKNDEGRDAIYRVCKETPNVKTPKLDENYEGKDAINRVSTGGVTKKHNPMLHHNLSRIIRWYKGRITFEIHKTNTNFAWQTRFYDHIIRDFDSYYRIEEYIQNNPGKWEEDGFIMNKTATVCVDL